ncbi:DUF4312 family protein [Enterococcus faecium]|uniref:DUF4312 family protein n=1 Tax=Enterococcus faecium TaxID=1352 RepID=UPI0035D57754
MSVQKTIQQKVIVSGKGETKQHAFASALAEIQNKIMEQSNVLLRIEPVNVDILKAVENKYTERFLFFFFPRQCISYEVELSNKRRSNRRFSPTFRKNSGDHR